MQGYSQRVVCSVPVPGKMSVKFTVGSMVVIGLALTAAVLLGALNESRPPDPMPEQWKVKVIETWFRAYKALFGVLTTLGISQPLSPLDRALTVSSQLTLSTGWPFWTYTKDDLKITDTKMAGVRVKVYEPTASLDDKSRPVLVYFHGGCWSIFSVDAYEPLTSTLALDSGVVVVSVDYGLSPENPFPGPRDDCLTVVNHVISRGKEMGLDTTRVGIGGDSAGGNIAASVALELKDRIALQVMIAPVLQSIDTRTPSTIENMPYLSFSINDKWMFSTFLLHAGLPEHLAPAIVNNTHVPLSIREKFYSHKLNFQKLIPSDVIRTPALRKHDGKRDADRPETLAVWKQLEKIFMDPYFSPLLADDDMLRQTAPCYVVTQGYDIIRDDGVMYYHRLKNNGVQGVWRNYPESFHHTYLFHFGPLQLDVGTRIVKEVAEYIKKEL